MSTGELERLVDSASTETNPEILEQRDKLKKNAKEYPIQKGDTVASIAKKFGLENYIDLINFNRLLGVEFKERGTKGTNFTIRPHIEGEAAKIGTDTLYVPADIEVFKENLKQIRLITDAMRQNELVARRDTKALRKEIGREIFPTKPVSLGAGLLNGFASNQEITLDPEHPRIVDIARQKNVSCANLIRTLMGNAMDVGDLKPGEKAFFRKQNVDAWMLPEELKKVGFTQKKNLMTSFDTERVGQNDPMPPEKQADYDRQVLELGKYLETEGKPFSLMPIYFRHSNYRGVVAGFNQGKKPEERHYNTHQSMFLRNGELTVPAREIPEIKNGQAIPFGVDKDKIQKEIAKLQASQGQAENGLTKNKGEVLDALDKEWSDNKVVKTFTVDKIMARYVAHLNGEAKDKQLDAIRKVVESENIGTIQTELSRLIKYPVTEDDAKYLVSLQSRKRKTIDGVKAIREHVAGKPAITDNEAITVDTATESGIQGTKLAQAISAYNAAVNKVNGCKKSIEDRKKMLENIDKADVAKREEIVKLSLENAQLLTDMRKAETDRDKMKPEVIALLDPKTNPEIEKALSYLSRRVQKLVGETERGPKTERFLKALEANDRETLVTKFHQSEADVDYLRSFLKKRDKFIATIESVKTELGLQSAIRAIPENEFSKALPADHPLLAKIKSYNENIGTINTSKHKIAENEERMKEKKALEVSEYVYSFIAHRADYSSALGKEGKSRIIEGIKKNADIIHLTINGKKLDLAAELAKPEKDRLRINPDDTVSISGPLLVHGMHRLHPDPDKKENMNATTRFYFEFAATQTFYPTELLEPTKDSSFALASFDTPAKNLKTKGTYDLRYKRDESGTIMRDKRGHALSESIDEVLKARIPQFEREAFAKLNPEDPKYQEKYDALIQRYYSEQIKALQLSGFLQDETTLNKSATNLNRPIPYFDVNGNEGKALQTAFNEHITTRKSERKQENADTMAFREYLQVEVFPGDTYATIFRRISDYIPQSGSHLKKYPNIRVLSQINDLQKLSFLERIVPEAITNKRTPTAEDLLQNKIKAGGKFILHYQNIDAILGELRNSDSQPSIGSILRKTDKDVIALTVPFNQNRSLIERALYVESYVNPDANGPWYKPSRRFIKANLEPSNQALPVRMLNALDERITGKRHLEAKSLGDFQIRIQGLKNGWNTEWPREEHVRGAFSALFRKEAIDYVTQTMATHPDKKRIEEDLSIAHRARMITEKSELDKRDFEMLTELLSTLFRLDDGSGSNVVGKILSASLLNDKINNHFRKLNGVLEASGENPRAIQTNPQSRESYEDMILMANNLGETNVVYGLAENRLIRLLEKSGIVAKNGITLSHPELQTSGLSGSIKYGSNTFIAHVRQIVQQIDISGKPVKNLLTEATALKEYYDGKGVQPLPETDRIRQENVIMGAVSAFCNRVFEAEKKTGAARDKALKEAILDFNRDPALKTVLENYAYDAENPKARISASILPTEEERRGRGFRDTFFNYIRKTDEAEKASFKQANADKQEKRV